MQLLDFSANPVLLLYLSLVNFSKTASYFRPSPLLSSTLCSQTSLTKPLVPVYWRILKKSGIKSEYTSSCTFHFFNTYSVQLSPKRSTWQCFPNLIPTSTLNLHRIFSSKSPLLYPFTSSLADIPLPQAWSSIMGAYIHNKSWGGLKSRQSA
jgi:hypothetical protein